MTEYPPTSPVYDWPLLEGDQPNDWRHVDAALLAVEATVQAVEAVAGAPADVAVTTDASLTSTESPANAFALAVRLSPDAGNALALRANGLFGTDTTGSGGGAVTSVNGETGAVVLDAADVGAATPAGLSAAVATHAALADAHHAKDHNHTAADGSGALTNEAHDGYSQYANLGADPATPATNQIRLYAKDNGAGVATLYYVTENGQIYELPTLTTGGNGSGAPSNASYVTLSAETKLSQETALGAGVIMSGLLSARPAFGTAGRLYLATDTDLVYRDSGAAWATFATRTVATGLATDPLANAKGDVFAASANDAVGRLALGTDGHVLTADSTQTLGVKWAAGGGGSGISQAAADARYVALAGSTMTGTLTTSVLTAVSPTTATVSRVYGTATTVPPVGSTVFSGTFELGLRFRSTPAGLLTAIRWYRLTTGQSAPLAVRLWDTTSTATAVWTASAGELTPLADTAVGWKTVTPLVPPALVAGREYVVAYATTTDYSRTSTFTPTPDSPLVFVNHVFLGTPGTFPTTTFSEGWLIDAGVSYQSTPVAGAGAVRLANNTAVGWRNAANSADLALTMNASDHLALTVAAGALTTSATAGAASALPGVPAGYLTVTLNGTARKLAFWAV